MSRATVLLFTLVLQACTQRSSQPFANAHLPDLVKATLTASPVQEIKGYTLKEFHGQAGAADLSVRRLENIPPEAAAKVMQQKQFQVEALYREEKSPYAGFVSKMVHCPQQFQPLIRHDTNADTELLRIEAAANSRKILGVCSESEFQSKAVLLYLYCKKPKLLLQLESFLPKTANAAIWLTQVSCE
jgi:hypothetical protein